MLMLKVEKKDGPSQIPAIWDSLGRPYDPTSSKDKKRRRLIEQRVASVEKRLNYKFLNPHERERQKRSALHRIYSGVSDADRYQGVLDLIQADFDRSLAKAVNRGYQRQHPKFEDYAAYYDRDNFVEDLRPLLNQDYPYRPGVISDGQTDWLPR